MAAQMTDKLTRQADALAEARTDVDTIVAQARALRAAGWNDSAIASALAEPMATVDGAGVRAIAVRALIDLADLAPLSAGPMPKLVDTDGMEWTWRPAGYLREDDAETLTAEQVKADFEAVEVST